MAAVSRAVVLPSIAAFLLLLLFSLSPNPHQFGCLPTHATFSSRRGGRAPTRGLGRSSSYKRPRMTPQLTRRSTPPSGSRQPPTPVHTPRPPAEQHSLRRSSTGASGARTAPSTPSSPARTPAAATAARTPQQPAAAAAGAGKGPQQQPAQAPAAVGAPHHSTDATATSGTPKQQAAAGAAAAAAAPSPYNVSGQQYGGPAYGSPAPYTAQGPGGGWGVPPAHPHATGYPHGAAAGAAAPAAAAAPASSGPSFARTAVTSALGAAVGSMVGSAVTNSMMRHHSDHSGAAASDSSSNNSSSSSTDPSAAATTASSPAEAKEKTLKESQRIIEIAFVGVGEDEFANSVRGPQAFGNKVRDAVVQALGVPASRIVLDEVSIKKTSSSSSSSKEPLDVTVRLIAMPEEKTSATEPTAEELAAEVARQLQQPKSFLLRLLFSFFPGFPSPVLAAADPGDAFDDAAAAARTKVAAAAAAAPKTAANAAATPQPAAKLPCLLLLLGSTFFLWV